jgi:hypothetical protein
MESIFMFILFILIIYLIYYFLVLNDPKKIEKYKKSTEVFYLVKRYKLDLKAINFKKLAHLLALVNALIISITVSIIMFFDNYFIMLLLGLIVVFGLVLIMYHIVGTYYKNRK